MFFFPSRRRHTRCGREFRRVLFRSEFGTDRLASAILEFPSGQSVFTCGTQLVRYQRMQFLGTKGRIEIKIPFNAPNRSEERRVGEECRSRWSAYHLKKKKNRR